MRNYYTIEQADVGKRFLRAFGTLWPLADSIGYVQAGDVGKRLYRVGPDQCGCYILQCENDEQRDRRLASGTRIECIAATRSALCRGIS